VTTLSDRRVSTILGVILIASAALRLAQVRHGLPYPWVYDEGQRVGQTFEILEKIAEGRPFEAVPTMLYPPMYLYLCAGVIGGASAISGLAGQFSPEALRMVFWSSKGHFILMARAVSLVWGVGVVWMMFLTGRRLFDRRTGLLAALTVALLPAAQWFSVLALADMQRVFFVLAALYFAAGIIEKGRMRDYVLCGAMVGFAAATKYNGIAAALAGAVAHVATVKGKGRTLVWAFFSPKAFAMAAAAIGAFALGCPYVYLALGRFLSSGEKLVGLQITARPTVEGGFWAYLSDPRYLLSMVGPVMLALCLVGLVRAATGGRKGVLAAAFTVGVFLFISSFRYKAGRHVMELVCLVALLASAAVSWLWESAGKWRSWAWVGRLACVLALVGALAAGSVRQMLELAGPDTRLLAKAWIEANVPAGAAIAGDDLQAQLVDEDDTLARLGPRFNGRAYHLLEMGHMFQFDEPLAPFKEYTKLIASKGVEYVVLNGRVMRPLVEAGEFFGSDEARKGHFEKFYRWVLGHGDVVQCFQAQPWRNRGPDMIIVRLR